MGCLKIFNGGIYKFLPCPIAQAKRRFVLKPDEEIPFDKEYEEERKLRCEFQDFYSNSPKLSDRDPLGHFPNFHRMRTEKGTQNEVQRWMDFYSKKNPTSGHRDGHVSNAKFMVNFALYQGFP